MITTAKTGVRVLAGESENAPAGPEAVIHVRADGRHVRAKEVLGRPFVPVPGDPPEHKVLGVVQGKKLRRLEIGMTWNDMLLMDTVYGDGYFAGHCAFTGAVLVLCEKIYGVDRRAAREAWASAEAETVKAKEDA